MASRAVGVTQDDGRDGRSGVNGALKEGAMEGQDVMAVAGRSLGEHGNQASFLQMSNQIFSGRLGGAAGTAFDENRIRVRTQPADQRPGAHVVFGDEGGRGQGIDGEDVEEGDVVGDNHALHRRGRRRHRVASADF